MNTVADPEPPLSLDGITVRIGRSHGLLNGFIGRISIHSPTAVTQWLLMSGSVSRAILAAIPHLLLDVLHLECQTLHARRGRVY
jgi:hypothetical protein